MAKDDAKIVDVEKIEREGDDLLTAGLEMAVLGPFSALTIDPGGTEYTVTLEDGRVGRGSTKEEAIADARKK